MKELEKDELKEINGGFWWVLEVLAAGLAYELITEGFEQCAADFKAGYQSTRK
jgi:bacteriocin-like protein